MSVLQINAELYRVMGTIADDETLMSKLLEYAKSLASRKEDPTLMTREEFLSNVDEAAEQARQGHVHRMLPNETLDQFLTRVG